MRDFELIYASELEKKQNESGALVVDIRDSEEYKKEHWPGAVNYPYNQIERGGNGLPRNRKLIFYCDHGGGSMQIAQMLGRQGFQVASVVGGYEAMKKFTKSYFKNRQNM